MGVFGIDLGRQKLRLGLRILNMTHFELTGMSWVVHSKRKTKDHKLKKKKKSRNEDTQIRSAIYGQTDLNAYLCSYYLYSS